MEARLRSGAPSGGNDDKLRLLTQQLDTLNQTVKQLQAKLREAQVELASKTKAIESSHLLNKKLDKEVQQLKEEVGHYFNHQSRDRLARVISQLFTLGVVRHQSKKRTEYYEFTLPDCSWTWREVRAPEAIGIRNGGLGRSTKRRSNGLFMRPSKVSQTMLTHTVVKFKQSKHN